MPVILLIFWGILLLGLWLLIKVWEQFDLGCACSIIGALLIFLLLFLIRGIGSLFYFL